MHGPSFVSDLAIVLGVAAATSVVARWLKQPTILGYLAAGLLVGPYIPIPPFAELSRVEALAEFGVVLVMFVVGLEFRIARLMRVLPISGLTGVLQVSFLFFCGFGLGGVLGWSGVERTFLGCCVAISSTMVVSKVLDAHPVDSDIRDHVFGVLVIQDVVAIVLVAAMTGVAAGGGLEPEAMVAVLAQLAAVLMVILVVGIVAVPRIMRQVMRTESTELVSVFSVALCFGLAALADTLGYSVALGAFIAGILAAESGRGADIEHLMQPVRDMFAAVFFVSIGMAVDPRQAVALFGTSLLVTGAVIFGQFLIVSLAGLLSGLGLRRSLTAGLALGQIGEFAFILAGIGVTAGVVRKELQPILLTVAVLTAFTTPALLSVSDRLVHFVDNGLPRSVTRLLGLYEEWFERLRSQPAESQGRLRHSLYVVILDASAVLILLHLSVTWLRWAAEWVAAQTGIESHTAGLVLFTGAAVMGLPLMIGLVRNTLWLSRLAEDAVLRQEPQVVQRTAGRETPSPAARIAAGILKVMIRFVVAFGVGVPMVAILQPLTGPLDILFLGLLLVGVVIYVLRKAGQVEPQFRSGAVEIARALAAKPEDHVALRNPRLLPGLDVVTGLSVSPGSQAVDRTLAELDLRARTGATVVAIQRAGARVILPTGHERLEPGDVLAVAGTQESIQLADRLLQGTLTSDLHDIPEVTSAS
ncbi:MAG: cation:proton antiporter [Myxococcota bacterium]